MLHQLKNLNSGVLADPLLEVLREVQNVVHMVCADVLWYTICGILYGVLINTSILRCVVVYYMWCTDKH